MTPEQIELAKLSLAQLQLWITGLAIFLGPLSGVLFTFWIQNRKAAHDAKLKLFLTLMTERKDVPFSKETSDALNTIDVIFHDNQKVVELWHKHFALRQIPHTQETQHSWVELLSQMAQVLKYSNLRQIDLDKFYIPQGHTEQAMIQKELRTELLRVLKETKHLATAPEDI